jgi:hypothetical protein
MDIATEFESQHADAATREGWGLFDCDGSEHSRWQLQRIDCAADVPCATGEPRPAQLASDDDAWRIVWHGTGAHHVAAREFLQAHAPAEWAALAAFFKDGSK